MATAENTPAADECECQARVGVPYPDGCPRYCDCNAIAVPPLGLCDLWVAHAPHGDCPGLTQSEAGTLRSAAIARECNGPRDCIGTVTGCDYCFRPDWPKTCDRCRGTGTIGGHGDLRTCPDCNGSGLPKDRCASLKGRRRRELQVRAPARRIKEAAGMAIDREIEATLREAVAVTPAAQDSGAVGREAHAGLPDARKSPREASDAACGYRIVLAPRGVPSQTCPLPAGHDGPHTAEIPSAASDHKEHT